MTVTTNNIVPPMTDPLGRGWDQPDPAEILIDDTHAVMTQRAFHTLLEYSRSMPSDVYPGKMWMWMWMWMWKRNAAPGVWWLCWYGMDETWPKACTNNWREILITY